MKKYFSWTGLVFVLIYGFWVLNVYYETQDCTGNFCGLGVLKTLMPALVVLAPFGSMIKSQSAGGTLAIIGYAINIIFYYGIGLLVGKAFSLAKDSK